MALFDTKELKIYDVINTINVSTFNKFAVFSTLVSHTGMNLSTWNLGKPHIVMFNVGGENLHTC